MESLVFVFLVGLIKYLLNNKKFNLKSLKIDDQGNIG
jgi:hypothetical protein